MDHWGDPWADANANDSPTKDTVASPPPQHATFTPAPVLLNGFLDDAQWGNNEQDTLSGWGSPQKPERDDETRIDGVHVATGWEDVEQVEQKSGDLAREGKHSTEDTTWDSRGADIEGLCDVDNVVSETSDSATTIQPDNAHIPLEKDSADLLPPDDDVSMRSCTSPSDASRIDVATESPRTSFEDEQATGTVFEIETGAVPDGTETVKEDTGIAASSTPPETEDANDAFGDFEDNVTVEKAEDQSQAGDKKTIIDEANSSSVRPRKTSSDEEHDKDAISGYKLDEDVLSQLFSGSEPTTTLSEAPSDPVHSTSTRKAWYRLARKQTMREYNNGATDDNYIRVTWKSSHIRFEVLKTVSRWATEDRLAGRGPGARASFYWDTPVPENQALPFHTRKRSSISASIPMKHDDRQSVPQLDTNVPAAFNWSSPSGAQDPWNDATNARAVSSPVAPPKHTTVARLQRQEGRPSSVDLTPRPKDPASHKRTSTNVDLFSAVPISPIAPPKPSPTTVIDPWASLGALDTNPPSKPASSAPVETGDDDDEWGEMVESPAVSSAHTITEFAPPSRNNTSSTPSTTPRSAKSSPLQPLPLPVGSKHASPIVRLKGTVSPTSAIFKANAFVPANVEDGPIGPGLLKPRNRSAEGTPEKARAPPPPVAQLDEVLHRAEPVQPPEAKPVEDEFSAFETSLPSPTPTPRTATPPPEPTTDTTATTDSPPPPTDQLPQPWSDADVDLSLFESSFPAPTPTPARAQTPPPPDPTDPWSIFDTPAPEPAPFTRTPPRPVTPLPKQPLTSATSSAQRRKAEEDEVIRAIVRGLPDLGYMLRR